jgi:hypothetical protein
MTSNSFIVVGISEPVTEAFSRHDEYLANYYTCNNIHVMILAVHLNVMKDETHFKCNMFTGLGLGLWCLTPLLTIVQLYRGKIPGQNHRPTNIHCAYLPVIILFQHEVRENLNCIFGCRFCLYILLL